MTNQEAFNNALFGLRKQAAFSVSEVGICRYRDEKGNGCAIGVQLSDILAKRLDKRLSPGICHVLMAEPEVCKIFEGVSHELLKDLQMVHDICADQEDWENWEKKMKDIAAKFHLTYTPK